jgi:hypothetical protein
MKGTQRTKALTLGEFIVSIYDACGKQGAKEIIRLALNAHIVAFPGRRYFIISPVKY